MKQRRINLTQERLKEVLRYDPKTGNLIGICRKRGRSFGRIMGYRMNLGYLQVGVDGVVYLAHRLVWLYHHGFFPPQHLDHIDGDPTNNRISNLRLASASQNLCNSKLSASNKSGYKGVHFDKSRNEWMAYLRAGGVQIFRKRFDTKKEAVSAVRDARNRYHGEFANHG